LTIDVPDHRRGRKATGRVTFVPARRAERPANQGKQALNTFPAGA